MNISQLARETGVPAKTIRYYESVGLIPAAARTGAGYRIYQDRDVRMLRFVARSRALGFTVDDVAHLLALWRDTSRSSADVKAMARHQVEEIDRRINELSAMRTALLDLIQECHGDERPDCPILDELAGETCCADHSPSPKTGI